MLRRFASACGRFKNTAKSNVAYLRRPTEVLAILLLPVPARICKLHNTSHLAASCQVLRSSGSKLTSPPRFNTTRNMHEYRLESI